MNDVSLDFTDSWSMIRLLQDGNSSSSNSTASAATKSDSSILRDTFYVYGLVFLVFTFLFCVLRKLFPRWYALRQWVEEIKSPIANDMFGFVSWIWKVLFLEEDALFQDCTLDFVCFSRLLKMGYRISLVAVFNAIWLVPLYASAPTTPATANVTDPVSTISVAHVPPGDPRLLGPALASYFFFGYVMYTIYHELSWFIAIRHQFLLRPLPRNYTVYIRNIPRQFRTQNRLTEFFRQIYSSAAVVEVHFLMRLPILSKLVARRDIVLSKLERAMALRDKTGHEPTHYQRTSFRRQRVHSIDVFAEELAELNAEITERIGVVRREQQYDTFLVQQQENGTPITQPSMEHIEECESENETEGLLEGASHGDEEGSVVSRACSLLKGSVSVKEGYQYPPLSPAATDGSDSQPQQTKNGYKTVTLVSLDNKKSRRESLGQQKHDVLSSPGHSSRSRVAYLTNSIGNVAKSGLTTALSGANVVTSTAKSSVHATANVVASTATQAASTVATTATTAAAHAASMLQTQDGDYDDAAFVVFSQLTAVHSTMQMLQHDTPFKMEVIEAPEPEDVFWPNVGRSHKDLQLGWLFSMAATSTLCIFWTVPMAFVASLNSVSALTALVPFVGTMVAAVPILEPVLQLLAPLLVTVLSSMLPTILQFISMFEGPISSATLEASKFTKLAAFSIIQTFFISALTKGAVEVASQISSQLQELISNPLEIVNLLATELSKNSTYFIQIVFVSTVTMTGLELLRATPLIMAAIRSHFGPNLTPREKSSAYLGLRPLALVKDFEQADFLSEVILLFMVLFVYASIAPIVSFVMVFCFVWLRVAYTNQNVFCYPASPDSGGKLWPKAIQIIIYCMMIAEVSILGMLGLRQSLIAIPLMVPLIVVTGLFSGYINQQHFMVAEHLTADGCIQAESKQAADGFDISFAKGRYIQPALQNETLLPDLLDGQTLPNALRDIENYNTPPQSEASLEVDCHSDVMG